MRKALVVGINNYTNCNSLGGCENDAIAVKEMLEFHANDDLNFTIVEPQFDVSTKVGLFNEISDFFGSSSSEVEIALFYFAGHGGYDDEHKEGFIVTTNYLDAIKNVIWMREILDMANKSNARNKFIILDCCHSGAMGNVVQSIAALHEGVTILSACKLDEGAGDDGGDGHGVFTSLFLKALEGGAADLTGHVTAGGVYAYIDKALGAIGQRPVFKTNTAQFLPMRKAEPPIAKGILRKLSAYFTCSSSEYPLNPSYEPTNYKGSKHFHIEPYVLKANEDIFEDLLALSKVGLVIPCCDDLPLNNRYMYFAAMESKSCKLTPVGKFYWKLAKDKKI